MIACVPVTGDFGTNEKNYRSMKKILSFFTINGRVWLKPEHDGPYNSITHLDDLKSLFPEENFTMSSLLYFSTHIDLFLQFFCCVQVQFRYWSISD